MDDRILGRNVPLKAGGPDPEATDEVMLTRRRVSRIYYHKKFFDYPVRMNANTIRNMGLATTVEAGMSYWRRRRTSCRRTPWKTSTSTASQKALFHVL